MKKISLLIIAFLLFGVSLYAQDKKAKPSLKALDEKYGFRDAKFEMDTTAIKDLVLVETGKTNKYYERTGDSKTIGGAEIERIVYGFYKGKLSTVSLSTKGIANSTALLEALTTQYGPGSRTNQYMRDYSWFGQKVIMSYDENSATRDAKVFLFSRPMVEIEKADQKAAAAKAGSDL